MTAKRFSFDIYFLNIGLLVIAGGFGILFFQSTYWLLYAKWFPIPFGIILVPLLTFLRHDFALWLYEPQSWIGLVIIIRWISEQPFSMVLIICGFLITTLEDSLQI